jgi:hypothetical protein
MCDLCLLGATGQSQLAVKPRCKYDIMEHGYRVKGIHVPKAVLLSLACTTLELRQTHLQMKTSEILMRCASFIKQLKLISLSFLLQQRATSCSLTHAVALAFLHELDY